MPLDSRGSHKLPGFGKRETTATGGSQVSSILHTGCPFSPVTGDWRPEDPAPLGPNSANAVSEYARGWPDGGAQVPNDGGRARRSLPYPSGLSRPNLLGGVGLEHTSSDNSGTAVPGTLWYITGAAREDRIPGFWAMSGITAKETFQ